MEAKMEELRVHAGEVEAHPDHQVSLTDADARSMMKAGGGSTVGYNVQTAVDSKHHLIVAHEVTNAPSDRSQLASMAAQAKAALAAEAADGEVENHQALTVVADPGYYKGEEIVDCYKAGITALVPKVDTSGKQAKGQYTRAEFRYDAKQDEYRCPAGEPMPYKFTTEEKGKRLRVYITFKCPDCPLKAKCTIGKERRIRRWVNEHWLEAAAAELQKNPDAMRQRKQLVEHPFGTIKHWMGSTHFLMKRLPNVQTEMSLHVLAYNLRRAINVLGVPAIVAKLQAA
jgi:hypothetical protein